MRIEEKTINRGVKKIKKGEIGIEERKMKREEYKRLMKDKKEENEKQWTKEIEEDKKYEEILWEKKYGSFEKNKNEQWKIHFRNCI